MFLLLYWPLLLPLCCVLERLCSPACSRVIWSPNAPVLKWMCNDPEWTDLILWQETLFSRAAARPLTTEKNPRFPSDSTGANRPIYKLLQNKHVSLAEFKANLSELILKLLSYLRWSLDFFQKVSGGAECENTVLLFRNFSCHLSSTVTKKWAHLRIQQENVLIHPAYIHSHRASGCVDDCNASEL